MKNTFMLWQQKACQNQTKIANKTFKNMAKSKYLGMPQKYQDYMH
jgi:hypothetical protein